MAAHDPKLLTPDQVFIAYIAIGPRRNLIVLRQKLLETYPPEKVPTRGTIENWQGEGEWVRRAQEHDTQVRETAERIVLEEQSQAAASQALVIQGTAHKAFQKLGALIDKIDEAGQYPFDQLAILAGIGERLIQASRAVGLVSGIAPAEDDPNRSFVILERLQKIVYASAPQANGSAARNGSNGHGPLVEHDPVTRS